MSDNESKALTQAEPEGLPAIAATDMDMARALVASGFFPTIKSASQALVKIQAGRELGFGPVASMMGIHVIEAGEGDKRRVSITLSANMLANLVRASGRDNFSVKEHTDEICSIDFYRVSGEEQEHFGTSIFTIADAKRAGLTERTGSLWNKYPKNMLFATAMKKRAKWWRRTRLRASPCAS